jgi:hypothetical protein
MINVKNNNRIRILESKFKREKLNHHQITIQKERTRISRQIHRPNNISQKKIKSLQTEEQPRGEILVKAQWKEEAPTTTAAVQSPEKQ